MIIIYFHFHLEKKPRYSTPERELLESSTEQHSLSGSEPSLQELEDLIEQNPILNRRSASSLLTKFKEIQRKKTIKILLLLVNNKMAVKSLHCKPYPLPMLLMDTVNVLYFHYIPYNI